jgi:lysophospholipase L1-like esterase
VTSAVEVRPFLRGCVWPEASGVPYPRANPDDARRMPQDTWSAAQLPAGVRLEMVGNATHIRIDYVTATDEFGYRGSSAGHTFEVWRGGRQVDKQPAVLGQGSVRLRLGDGDGRAVIYLPEGMKPRVRTMVPSGGAIAPAPPLPTWIAYGDSITEGWSASSPAHCWLAVAGRERAMDTVNLGFAGSARGEIVLAQQVAALDADVITVAYGTNCWATIPHSVEMVRANTAAFLRIIRVARPHVPVLVVSPLIRPDAESQPNALGATLADIRGAIESAVAEGNDPLVTLLPGADLIPATLLADGIHPGDEGHRKMARLIGLEVGALMLGSAGAADVRQHSQ